MLLKAMKTIFQGIRHGLYHETTRFCVFFSRRKGYQREVQVVNSNQSSKLSGQKMFESQSIDVFNSASKFWYQSRTLIKLIKNFFKHYLEKLVSITCKRIEVNCTQNDQSTAFFHCGYFDIFEEIFSLAVRTQFLG